MAWLNIDDPEYINETESIYNPTFKCGQLT